MSANLALVIGGLHGDELKIDTGLVRALLDRDLPQYADRPLARLAASGSTNVLYRLGPDLLVRLPRQPGNGDSVAKERRWSPLMATALPVAVPEIVADGAPGFGYPEPWSVVRWLDGDHPSSAGPDEAPEVTRTVLARDLAAVVASLRTLEVSDEAGTDPSLRWYRGRSLLEQDLTTRRNLEQCGLIEGLDLDLGRATVIWERALASESADPAEDRWYHGDLVAENLLLTEGRLSAVLDFGSIAVGDPTVDLHGAWELLDAPARGVFRDLLGVDDNEWLRGRAWALCIAVGTFTYYWDTMPGRRADRLAMIRNVIADPE